MPSGKWFRFGYGIIIVLVIIYLSSLVDFLLGPIRVAFSAIFLPILISGLFFYMMRPAVRLLNKWMPKGLSILIVYVLVICLLFVAFLIIWAPIREQSTALVKNFPSIVGEISRWIQSLQQYAWFNAINQEQQFTLENITSKFTNSIGGILNSIVGSVSSLIGMATSFFLLLGLIPFIVYYMLKDGHAFPNSVLRFLPESRRNVAKLTLQEIDASIGAFISSKLITALAVGILVYIGYLFIDLPYPLVMAMLAAVLNIIPYLGPFLAGVPTAIIALGVSPLTSIFVVLILVIANQIEGNLISPKIMGKQLNIHPLTIILLVIATGAILGPLGMVIIVPVYAIIKIIVIRMYQFYKEPTEAADPIESAEPVEPIEPTRPSELAKSAKPDKASE
jgi:predicted PurR-regulated permease PerM